MITDKEKIAALQFHIEQLVEEMKAINLNNPKLSAEEYLEEKNKLQNLKNLRAIARNELNSLLHQYRVTLSGQVLSNKGEITNRIVRKRLFTDIDCIIDSPATIKSSQKEGLQLLEIVKNDFSGIFYEGKFEVKRVKKIR